MVFINKYNGKFGIEKLIHLSKNMFVLEKNLCTCTSKSTFFSGEVINPHLDQVAMTSEIEGMPMVVVQVLSHIVLLK